VVKLDVDRLVGFTAIDDTGRATGDTQTAARTRSLLSALKSDEFHNNLLKKSTATSVTPVSQTKQRTASQHCTPTAAA
jgi:hypothetical protein